MKKAYVKPEIMFENFSLSTSIAGDCEQPYVNNASKGTCAVLGTGTIGVFSEEITGCDYDPGDDQWGGLCYHVPTEYNNLFNS